MTFSVCVCVCLCLSAAVSPINTGRILFKLHMEIPVHHAQCVWQKIEHRSKVKVTNNMKTTVWAITFEPEVIKKAWLQNIPDRNTYHKYPGHMTYEVPFLRHVTSHKTYDFLCFLNSSILYRLITCISMATKYPIIKHRAFFKTLTRANITH